MTSFRLALIGGALVIGAVACSAADTDHESTTALHLDTGDGGAPACGHAICASGAALVAACDPCATKLCGADPYCCGVAWDTTCVGEVASICKQSCTAPPPPPADAGSDSGPSDTCSHSTCSAGGPLVATCNTCATKLCALDPYCCGVAWDATCVGESTSVCQKTCN